MTRETIDVRIRPIRTTRRRRYLARLRAMWAAIAAAILSAGCGLYADGPDADIRLTSDDVRAWYAEQTCRSDYGIEWGACSHASIGNAPAGWGVDGGAWIDPGGRRFACAYVDEWGAIHAQTSYAYCGGYRPAACCREHGFGSDPR